MAENGLLEESVRQYGKVAETLFEKEQNPLSDNYGTVLHIAVAEGNSNIAHFLLESLKEHRENLKIFLFTRGPLKMTVLHLACKLGDTEIVKMLLEAAKGVSEHELRELIYSLNGYDLNALDDTIMWSSNAEVSKELFGEADNKLELVLNKNKKYNSLNFACMCGKEDFVKIILQEFKHDEKSVKCLLLRKEKYGNALYTAIYHSNIVEYLLSVAKSMKDNNETLKSLLLPERDNMPFNSSVSDGMIDSVEKLLNAAKYINDDCYTLKKMLFNDKTQKSSLLHAAEKGHCDIIKLLLETAASLDVEMLEKIIFSVNHDGKNAIHLLVENCGEKNYTDSFAILKEDKYLDIERKVTEYFVSIPLRDKLNYDYRQLSHSIVTNRSEKVKNILECAIKSNTKRNDMNPNEKLTFLLLAIVNEENMCNTLYVACENGYLEIIKVLLSYAVSIDDEGATLKELLKRTAFNNKTPFEVLKNGYTHEIEEIVENLILDAKNSNNEHVVNILKEVNSAQKVNSGNIF